MLDLKFIRENKEKVKENCRLRNFEVDVDRLLELDEKRREMIQRMEKLKNEKNKLNEEIKKSADKKVIVEKGKIIKKKLEEAVPEFEETEKEWKKLVIKIPNMTHPDAPIGKDDSENKEIERYGEPPEFAFTPKGHEELMKNLDLIDFERGAKVAGAKFYFLKNEAVFLEQALVNYALEVCRQEGFSPFVTPDLAKDEVLLGIGYNPRGEETQVYSIEKTDLNLVGTAEITMGGYHKDEAIDEKDLPLKYVALSHCFRTEAGSYGRHSAGLFRVHQFTKVEMFAYTLPENSEEMHTYFKDMEVKIFKGLGVPFRVVDICTGDLGGPAYRKYDLEAWMTSRDGWGEVTSTSDTTDYQARRLNVKVKREGGQKEFLHMLNGTAIATSRALIAIIENCQQADGSVVIPEVLRKWMPGGMKTINRK
ncbi:MAG: serine--tRNA ligase [Candidatus Moranbacteria bacterium RIFOXYB1_FULL_43_19]|nr:MAG: serine--tRNA ligase [Candidatus Moranbacteria bacterium RIFOXYB1_FULL_43_19]OGI33655.1 MAG: serine--tRNA ligase [Candidatus Moranbacteria bacterium RIFOXYC1_FULL_44_13]OGI37198.1 MAG: serine--tRNA ligase [Candidatus Moranbacteria bacterium RIFOXYD1_FULL_44_12]